MPTAALSAVDAGIVIAYLAGMLGVGWLVSRRITGFRDFFVAGGRMTTPVLVCTLVSTYYGLDVTFGTSETAYLEGVAAFFAYSAPFYLAYLATAVLVAPRLKALPAISLPEAMEHFYGKPARLASACASFFYSMPILSVSGMAILGRVLLGLEPWAGAVAGAVLALVYTVLGGLWADAITDTFQFVLMCISLSVAATLALVELGGPDEIAARVGAEFATPTGKLTLAQILVFGTVALTPLVEPAFYQRTFAARSGAAIRRALLLGMFLWIAFDWLSVYLGLAGRDLVLGGRLPEALDASEVIVHVCVSFLPVGLLGLFVAGCLAAAMSTVDSYSLIAAGNLVYDGWQPLARNKLTDRQLLLAVRVTLVLTLAAAVFLALRFERLRDAWIFMSTMLLSAVLVPMMAGLFFLTERRPRSGSWSAVAGLTTALALFLSFELLGERLDAEETRALTLPLGLGTLVREQALFLTLPVSLLAFALGYALDRRTTAASASTGT